MAKPGDNGDRQSGNILLARLRPSTRRRLDRLLEPVVLELKQTLHAADKPMDHVHFVESGVVSLVTAEVNGGSVELATIGNEGFVGTPLLLGTDRIPAVALCQIAGSALRMRAAAFLREVKRSEEFSLLLHRYVQMLIIQIAQSAACNRLHTVEKRAARWLLMTHDRVSSDTFALTQEFLSQMLGVRRAGVNVAAGILQRQGVIRYTRGVITVLDRRGLEKASCECYRIVRREFDRFIET